MKLTLLLTACNPTDKVDLLIDIKTDLVAGVEFVRVRTEHFESLPERLEAAPAAGVRERAVGLGEALEQGVRAAAYEAIEPGDHIVRIRLVGTNNEIVLERIAIFGVRRTSVFTVAMTRDCRGVVCPIPGGDPTLIACLNGQCVNPRCTEETGEFCPAGSCEVGVTCLASAACATPICTGPSVCLRAPDHGRCPAGQVCNPDEGCVEAGGSLTDASVDGGVSDAATDVSGPSPTPWGLFAAGLGLADCVPGPNGTMVVNTTADELEGEDPAIADPAAAGPELSLTEALHIAFNRPGVDVIMFDAAVFPAATPGRILIPITRTFPSDIGDVCIDGRDRGVEVEWVSDSAPCASCIWGLFTGARMMGITLLGLPHELRLRQDAQVAGCRFGTDGFDIWANRRSSAVGTGQLPTVGPGNVFAGNRTGGAVRVTSGGVRVVGNFIGYDPTSDSIVPLSNGIWIQPLSLTGVTEVEDNVIVVGGGFSTAINVASLFDAILIRRNFLGFDPTGRPLEGLAAQTGIGLGTPTSGPVPVTIGPDNLIYGFEGGIVTGDEGMMITQNRIYGNGVGIGSPVAPPTLTVANETETRGTCPVDGTVELFSDAADQGEFYLESVPCTASAEWVAGPGLSGRNVTATLTDTTNQTSGFSAPLAVP